MSKLLVNTFSSYELSQNEEVEGSMLNTYQEMVLRNKQAEIAEEKLLLEFDVTNPNSFIQQEAYKRGQLDLLSWILAQSEYTKEEYLNLTQQHLEN